MRAAVGDNGGLLLGISVSNFENRSGYLEQSTGQRPFPLIRTPAPTLVTFATFSYSPLDLHARRPGDTSWAVAAFLPFFSHTIPRPYGLRLWKCASHDNLPWLIGGPHSIPWCGTWERRVAEKIEQRSS